ncbi:MAG: MoxR family ATPase [Deltaproteobacteria bacterium]|nr:MoxR family ATPase [Deltaproteobacteria bacterium]
MADAQARLGAAGYVADRSIALTAYLSVALGKPILVEGPAGVGKTELARALATVQGLGLIRLQCYEGLDEQKALYEWEYGKQLLYTQLLRDKIQDVVGAARTLRDAADAIGREEDVFFSRRFLLPRPLMAAITSPQPVLLLVDEIDKADPEFEAFLLEVLSDFTISVPELGTISAVQRPQVILTSNNARELSDALKRRCLHLYIDYPTRERELAILRTRMPDAPARLCQSVVNAIHKLRALDLRKPPAVSETLDWARALLALGAPALDEATIADTLHVILKHQADVSRAAAETPALARAAADAGS